MYFGSSKLFSWQKHRSLRRSNDHDEVHERMLSTTQTDRSTSQRSKKSSREHDTDIEQVETF